MSLFHPAWHSLSFLDIYTFISFIKFGKFLSFFSSNILSSPFSLSSTSRTLTMCMLVCLMVSHKSFRLCSLFFNLFSFCFLELDNQVPNFVCLDMPLNYSTEFCISVIVMFSFRISLWFSFSRFHWFSILFIYLSYLFTFSLHIFSSLRICKTAF